MTPALNVDLFKHQYTGECDVIMRLIGSRVPNLSQPVTADEVLNEVKTEEGAVQRLRRTFARDGGHSRATFMLVMSLFPLLGVTEEEMRLYYDADSVSIAQWAQGTNLPDQEVRGLMYEFFRKRRDSLDIAAYDAAQKSA